MFADMSGLPLAGGALLASLAYGGASLFVTGPIVGERTIFKSGWAKTCAAHVRGTADAAHPSANALPVLDCSTLLGTMYGRDGEAFCRRYGGMLPFGNALHGLKQQQEDLKRSRIARAAESATARCECAANVVLEDRRTSFAIYAGSLRLIAPLSVKTLGSELKTALNSSSCAMKD